MQAQLVCYTLEKTTQTQRTALGRELNGYKDFSNKAKYIYKRKGILQEIKHIKPHPSVLIVKEENKKQLLKLLRKFKASIKKYKIQINHPKLA